MPRDAKGPIREREERHPGRLPGRDEGCMTNCLGWEQAEGYYRNITNQWY